ncbi:hypothetical protein N9934_01100 [Desulfosarcina sp.]|nr:hypothetical protein [Desulfosarcina sp.]
MFKKGQGISINVIIVAIIALLVLVVLTVIFGGRMGLWSTEIDDISNKDCTKQEGAQIINFDQNCPEGYQYSVLYTVPDNKKCCLEDFS